MTAPSTPADAGQETPGRRSPRSRSRTAPRSRRRRAAVVATALALLVVVALLVDAAVLATRIHRVPVQLHAGPGTTWVVVGLDSRSALPAGASAAEFGTADQVPGTRADVVLVLHQTAEETTVLSVPRDLLVGSGRHVSRLALTWQDRPQTMVDALCGMGIPTDHLVSVDLRGFAAVVDAAGGLDVDVPEPVRDPAAGLDLPEAGRLHVDGSTALALVRSRHPEHRVDGQWTPVPPDPDGRAAAAGTVLAALAETARAGALRPWRMQALAWAASGALTVDAGTSTTDLAALADAHLAEAAVLPARTPTEGTLSRFPSKETTATLAAAGLSCDP